MITRIILATALSLTGATFAAAQDADMSFFITSVNPGNGADLGGLEGADAYCGTLAEAAGVSGKTWAAYLSSSAENARDRIGTGPWMNANGVVVAQSVDDLHSDANNLTKETAVSETGAVISGRGDTPNRHDILTGSDLMGNLVGNSCEDWSTSGEGSAMVGHHDRTGGGDNPTAWNSAHGSRGCGMEALQGTGGDGLFYCFATN
ncbi:hypothetical protein EOK75_00975 [Pseudorhodobacter turbinis]|uniref:Lectin n=1 Tax=Pseudorhodobacter turbinis TaxID=2500533 RepID=A0A4P8ECS5_9RHOB|nr:hypothetical protein [Pseudorhodobacter turbinis]QCO54519.1 hypothetical protein EOK75_00975 [Pseudorhodobacter turbinis]